MEVKLELFILSVCSFAEATRVDFECFAPRPTLVSMRFKDTASSNKFLVQSSPALLPHEALCFSAGSEE